MSDFYVSGIDLLSLYVLFSSYRSCDNALEIKWTVFFQFRVIHVHMYEWFIKRQRVTFPWDLYCENKTYKLKFLTGVLLFVS